MRALRLLVLVLAWLPLCGVIVSQEGDQIEILLNEEYTGDKSKRSGFTFGGVTVPSGNNTILMAFMSMLDTTPGDVVISTINWDNAGTPQALTLRTLRSHNVPGSFMVYQQVGYRLDPSAVTGQFNVQFTGNIHSFGLTLMVFDNVDQDQPFDFADYFYDWPQNTGFKWNYSLAATHDMCGIDFLTKWLLVPGGSMQHDLGTPGGTFQVLRDNQKVGDAGSSSVGWRSISTLHSPSGVSECRYNPAIFFGMYRENTNFSYGGVYEIFHLREASKCIFGSAACTP